MIRIDPLFPLCSVIYTVQFCFVFGAALGGEARFHLRLKGVFLMMKTSVYKVVNRSFVCVFSDRCFLVLVFVVGVLVRTVGLQHKHNTSHLVISPNKCAVAKGCTAPKGYAVPKYHTPDPLRMKSKKRVPPREVRTCPKLWSKNVHTPVHLNEREGLWSRGKKNNKARQNEMKQETKWKTENDG